MADTKLIDMSEDTSPGNDSLAYTTDDPAGAPVDKKTTLQNILKLAPKYVPRNSDVAAFDFAVGALTTNGNWQDLDLSGIVPVGTKSVHLTVQIRDDATGQFIKFRKNGYSNELNHANFISTQVVNIPIAITIIVECDSNRIIEYKASNVTFTDINILVLGWFVDTVS